MGVVETPSLDMSKPAQMPSAKLLLLFAGGLGGGVFVAWHLPVMGGLLRGLMGDSPWRVGAMLWGLLLWVTVGPAFVSLLIIRRPLRAMALPVAAFVLGLVSWLMLSQIVEPAAVRRLLALPAEGGLTLPSPMSVAFHGGLALAMIVGLTCVGTLWLQPWTVAAKSIPALLLMALPWIVLCCLVVIGGSQVGAPYLRLRPVPGVAFIFLLVLLAGMHSMMLSRAIREVSILRIGEALLATVAVMPLCYWLYRLGLTPIAVGQLGGDGPSAANLPSDLAGLGQWSLVQVLLTAAMAAGSLAVVAVFRGGAAPVACDAAIASPAVCGTPSVPSKAVRRYAILAVAYAAFVTYGMFVPLEFHYVPLEAAVERYWDTPFLLLGVRQRADWVANGLLYMPLMFLAMGALTAAGRRTGQGTIGLFVAAGAMVLSSLSVIGNSLRLGRRPPAG